MGWLLTLQLWYSDVQRCKSVGRYCWGSNDWAKNLLRRMGFIKRKACSKAKVNPEHFEKLKEEFLLEIKNIVTMDQIPHELINFDQTALNYVPVTPWTIAEERAKRVKVRSWQGR